MEFSIIDHIISGHSHTANHPISGRRSCTTFSDIMANYQVLMTNSSQRASRDHGIKLQFQRSRISVTIIRLTSHRFSERDNFHQFLMFSSRLISLSQNRKRGAAFQVIRIIRQTRSFQLITVMRRCTYTFKRVMFARRCVRKRHAFKACPRSPSLYPIKRNRVSSKVLQHVIYRRLVNGTRSVP